MKDIKVVNQQTGLTAVGPLSEETLRILHFQVSMLGTVQPCLTYYRVMAWESFWVNPKQDVLERIAVTPEELLWILQEVTEHNDPLIERNVVSLVGVRTTEAVELFALYWMDVLMVEKLIIPFSNEFYFLDKGFNRYSVIHRSDYPGDTDLRWK